MVTPPQRRQPLPQPPDRRCYEPARAATGRAPPARRPRLVVLLRRVVAAAAWLLDGHARARRDDETAATPSCWPRLIRARAAGLHRGHAVALRAAGRRGPDRGRALPARRGRRRRRGGARPALGRAGRAARHRGVQPLRPDRGHRGRPGRPRRRQRAAAGRPARSATPARTCSTPRCGPSRPVSPGELYLAGVGPGPRLPGPSGPDRRAVRRRPVRAARRARMYRTGDLARWTATGGWTTSAAPTTR